MQANESKMIKTGLFIVLRISAANVVKMSDVVVLFLILSDESGKSLVDGGTILVAGNMKHFPNCPFAMTPTHLKG